MKPEWQRDWCVQAIVPKAHPPTGKSYYLAYHAGLGRGIEKGDDMAEGSQNNPLGQYLMCPTQLQYRGISEKILSRFPPACQKNPPKPHQTSSLRH